MEAYFCVSYNVIGLESFLGIRLADYCLFIYCCLCCEDVDAVPVDIC